MNITESRPKKEKSAQKAETVKETWAINLISRSKLPFATLLITFLFLLLFFFVDNHDFKQYYT